MKMAIGEHNLAGVGTMPGARAVPSDRRRLRIVHVVSSLLVGGMEQFVLQLAAEQSRDGHEVSIIGLRGGPLVGRAAEMGLQTIVLEESSRYGRIAAAIGVLWRFRPDIVNAHNPGALTYALLAKLRRNAHVIMTRHGQEAINPLPSGLKLRFTDCVIAVSDAAGQAMKRRRPETAGHIDVIKNGVHLDKPERSRAAVRAELGLGDGLVGVIVARIDRLKGHRILVEALKILKERGVGLTVLIAGDGPERADMEKYAEQNGLDGNSVRFLGFRDDVADLLAASDLFLLPSLTEGMPLSVLEAMAQRLPIVATSVGGIPELVRDGVHGLLVPTNDPAALADAVGKLANDPSMRAAMGESGYNRVKDDFSFAQMARRYEDLYFRFCR